MSDSFELLVPGLRFWVPLGCSAEERFYPQPVDIDIRIQFSGEPAGCRSDLLLDVCCYSAMANNIFESLRNKSFHLIERLACHVFDVVSKQLESQEALVEVTITKPHHPVQHAQKPISFKYARRLCLPSS